MKKIFTLVFLSITLMTGMAFGMEFGQDQNALIAKVTHLTSTKIKDIKLYENYTLVQATDAKKKEVCAWICSVVNTIEKDDAVLMGFGYLACKYPNSSNQLPQ